MKLTDKNKEKRINLQIREIRNIFNIEKDDTTSPLYKFLNRTAHSSLVDGFDSDLFNRTDLIRYLYTRHPDIIKGSSENVDKVLELADSIVNMLLLDKEDINDVLLKMLFFHSDIVNIVRSNEGSYGALDVMDRFFSLIYPTEKKELLSNILDSLSDCFDPGLLIPHKESLMLLTHKLQLTDSDRDGSMIFLTRLDNIY